MSLKFASPRLSRRKVVMVAVLLAVVVLARPAYVGVNFFMRGVGGYWPGFAVWEILSRSPKNLNMSDATLQLDLGEGCPVDWWLGRLCLPIAVKVGQQPVSSAFVDQLFSAMSNLCPDVSLADEQYASRLSRTLRCFEKEKQPPLILSVTVVAPSETKTFTRFTK